MARKIVIAIHKGGVGKTTTAKNLAAALALKGKRTLLIDLDEQANATKGLGINPLALEATLNDLFADPNRATSSVIFATGIDGLHIIPAHPDLAKTETGMALQRADPNNPDPIGMLKLLLEPLNDSYDFIIFDTPPSLNYQMEVQIATLQAQLTDLTLQLLCEREQRTEQRSCKQSR